MTHLHVLCCHISWIIPKSTCCAYDLEKEETAVQVALPLSFYDPVDSTYVICGT